MSAHDHMDDTIRYVLSFGLPFAAALVVTPFVGRFAHRIGLLDAPSPGGHKTHVQVTPYLGGLAIAVALVGVAIVTAGTEAELLAIVGNAVALGILGGLDDAFGLDRAIRLSYQAVTGISLWIVGIQAGVADTTWVDLPLTVLWVVAVVNAYNFIDNMDGVAAGTAAASTLGVAAIAASNGDFLVASFAFAVCGAALGFLRWNLPPAAIFLGDAGSMLLGFLVASLILKLDLPVADPLPRALSVVLLAAVPLFDLTLVTVDRLRGRRSPFRGGTDHLTHRLAARGWSRPRIAAAFGLAQAAASAVAVRAFRLPAPVVVGMFVALGAAWVVLLATASRMPVLVRPGPDEGLRP
jgi:UDP-GlcNAc:undecaprenyl-phosphate GlcNAc-1-phosphate transferase